MSTNDKIIRLYVELFLTAVGIIPLTLLFIAANGGFSDTLHGFRKANGIVLQFWQYGLLVVSTICIYAALSVFNRGKEMYLRWRVAHSFRISELDAHLSNSLGVSRFKESPMTWVVTIVIIGLGGAITALHNTAFTIHQGQMAINTYAHAAVISPNGDLNLNPSLHFSYNCSSFNLGTPARQVDTCPFGYSPEGMMDYLANSQVANGTGMSEYGGMIFSDQQPVPAIMEIMNSTVNAIANYSNVPLFDYSVNCTIESSQTFDQQVFIVQNGQPAVGIPNIYSAKGNNTQVANQYSVAGWDSAHLVAMMVFPDGDGTGKVVFPTTTNVDNKLNRTVCSMKYIQQQGNVYIDFSNKNVSVTVTETMKPNRGQLEIANYTLLEFTNLAVVASQLYRSPFSLYLGNDTDGNYSPKFLATQIKALLRKGHYLINTGFVNSGSGTIKQIEGTLYVSANQFNNILLITIVLFIQTLLHLIGIIIVLLSFCTPVIAADVYAASTWWAFGSHASDKLVSGCTGIMSKEQRNMKIALRETSSGYLQMTIPTEGIAPSENPKYIVNI